MQSGFSFIVRGVKVLAYFATRVASHGSAPPRAQRLPSAFNVAILARARRRVGEQPVGYPMKTQYYTAMSVNGYLAGPRTTRSTGSSSLATWRACRTVTRASSSRSAYCHGLDHALGFEPRKLRAPRTTAIASRRVFSTGSCRSSPAPIFAWRRGCARSCWRQEAAAGKRHLDCRRRGDPSSTTTACADEADLDGRPLVFTCRCARRGLKCGTTWRCLCPGLCGCSGEAGNDRRLVRLPPSRKTRLPGEIAACARKRGSYNWTCPP